MREEGLEDHVFKLLESFYNTIFRIR